MVNPDMPTQELLLHMGEMTAQEIRTARAAIRWANSFYGEEPVKGFPAFTKSNEKENGI